MTDTTEHLFNQYCLGQAYKNITFQNGPSKQLLAFVNHDSVDCSEMALESFDLNKGHTEILSEIDNSNSLDLACESFENDLTLLGNCLLSQDCDSDGTHLSAMETATALDRLSGSYDVIATLGANSSTIEIMRVTNLLSSSSHSAIALENSISYSDEQNKQLALESIISSIKDKAASWADKILAIVKKIAALSIKDAAGKIAASSKALVAKVSDVAHDTKKIIKAHPYKSAMILIGSIAAAAAVVTFIGQKIGSTNIELDKIAKETEDLYNKVSGKKAFPWGKDHHKGSAPYWYVHDLYFDGNRSSNGAMGLSPTLPNTGTWEELGWTKSNIVEFSIKTKALMDQVVKAISTFTSGAMSYLSNHKDNLGTEAVHIPGVSKRTSHQIITSLFWMVYRLVKTQIGAGFHQIAALILRLMGH